MFEILCWGCSVCWKEKSINKSPVGLLEAFTLPERKWENVSMDFIVGLARSSNGNDGILTMVECEEVVLSMASRWLARVAIVQTLMSQRWEVHSASDAGFQETPAGSANKDTRHKTWLISHWPTINTSALYNHRNTSKEDKARSGHKSSVPPRPYN